MKKTEMVSNSFQDRALNLVSKVSGHSVDQLFVVWFCKTLQNWKALVATTVPGDGLYFEITHNGDSKETYIDTYKKEANTNIADEENLNA